MSFTIKFELNHKKSTDGRANIQVRVTKDRKLARHKTDVYVKPKDFNAKAQFGKWVRSSEVFHARYNAQLTQIAHALHESCSLLLKENEFLTAKQLLDQFMKKDEAQHRTWLAFFEQAVQFYAERKQLYYSILAKVVLNKLSTYLEHKDIPIVSSDLAFIQGFEKYLHRIGNGANTINSNLKVVKQIYRQAIRAGIVKTPNLELLEYKVKTSEVQREKLTQEEIKQMIALELEPWSSLWHARNYFLFSFYCAGIRFGDFAQLRWSNIHENDYLKYRMGKTQKLQSLRLPKQAKSILAHYQNPQAKAKDFIFPLLPKIFDDLDQVAQRKQVSSKNALTNKNLGLLQKKMMLSKRLSFHIARHSFAYIGFKKTKDPQAVQNALMHSKLKETQLYISSLANDKERDILDEIFGHD